MRTLLLVLALWCSQALAAPHDTTLRLNFERGQCSGTAVGPHTVLTAWHCAEYGDLTHVDGSPVVQDATPINDRQDHALIHLANGKFQTWAKLGPLPKQGAAVFMYGNPYGNADVLRVGWMAGIVGLQQWFQMSVYPGDSGSAIFDKTGRIVAVVSATPVARDLSTGKARRMDAFTIAKPLRFTAAQWKEALQ